MSDSELGELLEVLDVEEFCDREGIDYKLTRGSSGMQVNVKVCPVCGNNKWKVYLNAETGLGNCFAGDHPPGQNFNKWRFVRSHFLEEGNAEVIAYLKRLAVESGWKAKRKTSVATIERSEIAFPSDTISLDGKNLVYLTNRGIGQDEVRYFHLHYCANGYFRYKLKEEWKFQPYIKRVIIPVYDMEGELVTFQGRDITGQQQPKYLFPPGLEASGTHLYNGFNVHATKRVVVGEGAFDVIALKMAMDDCPDLRDVVPVGTFGKHLSWGDDKSQQAKFLQLKEQRGVEEVTFMWDGEVPATDAAVEAAKIVSALGLRVRIAMLPKDQDPNEVPKEVVQRAFYEAIPFNAGAAAAIMLTRRRMNR